jgi:hypothetical protein
MAVSHLRVTGPPQYASAAGGLNLFKTPGSSSQAQGLTASQQLLAQPRPSQQAAQAAAVAAAADVYLSVLLEGLPGQGFPLRLRPGAPAALELLPGERHACRLPRPACDVGVGGSNILAAEAGVGAW